MWSVLMSRECIVCGLDERSTDVYITISVSFSYMLSLLRLSLLRRRHRYSYKCKLQAVSHKCKLQATTYGAIGEEVELVEANSLVVACTLTLVTTDSRGGAVQCGQC